MSQQVSDRWRPAAFATPALVQYLPYCNYKGAEQIVSYFCTLELNDVNRIGHGMK